MSGLPAQHCTFVYSTHPMLYLVLIVFGQWGLQQRFIASGKQFDQENGMTEASIRFDSPPYDLLSNWKYHCEEAIEPSNV